MPLHLEARVQIVPGRRFVGVQHGALGDAVPDPGQRGALGLEHARQRLAAALADHDDDLALAGLVLGQAAVDAVLGQVGGPHVAAEVGAIDLGLGAVVADLRPFISSAIASRSLCASTKADL